MNMTFFYRGFQCAHTEIYDNTELSYWYCQNGDIKLLKVVVCILYQH